MRRASRKKQVPQVRANIRWLESAIQFPVRRNPIDRSIQHAIALVNVLRGEVRLKAYVIAKTFQSRRPLQLVENHLTIRGEHLLPIMMRPQIRRVHQNIQRLSRYRDDVAAPQMRRRALDGFGQRMVLIDLY